MMNCLHYFFVQLDELSLVISVESIFNSRDSVNMIYILQHNCDLPDNCVHTGTHTSQTYDVGPHFLGMEKLGGSWSWSHIFFLELKCVAWSELTLFDDKLTWRHHRIEWKKRFFFIFLHLFGE